jgi:peptidoglycan/xylan/chitin deacetylase (PgdA/CDA1 family)
MSILNKAAAVILYLAATALSQTYELYPIKGDAVSITGTKLKNLIAWRKNAVNFAEKNRSSVIVNMNPAEKVIYLTFDDGPDSVNTIKVMNILKKYGVSGTFFFTGEGMKKRKTVVKQVHDSGFPIGLHGYDHTSMQKLTKDGIIADLNKTNDVLEEITGVRTTIMRPPYGDIGDKSIETISAQNLLIYLWSIDTLDWAAASSSEILQNVKKYLRPGDIILMHSYTWNTKTVNALPAIIEFIQEMGYEMRALPSSF